LTIIKKNKKWVEQRSTVAPPKTKVTCQFPTVIEKNKKTKTKKQKTKKFFERG